MRITLMESLVNEGKNSLNLKQSRIQLYDQALHISQDTTSRRGVDSLHSFKEMEPPQEFAVLSQELPLGLSLSGSAINRWGNLDRVNRDFNHLKDELDNLIGHPSSQERGLVRLCWITGEQFSSSVSIRQLNTNRFAPAQLLGTILNTFAEMTANDLKELSRLKAQTGEVEMDVENRCQPRTQNESRDSSFDFS